MVFVLDNYDSFTYNLVQYLGELGAEVVVRRNDQVTVAEVEAMKPERIVLSPGPCTPHEAGISIELIRQFAGKVPVLGVCLGHQAIGAAFGGRISRANHLMHGKTSQVQHDGKTIFREICSPITATRYHSLIVEEEALPDELEVSAWTTEGDGTRVIMGLRHREFPIEGVQFHPESVLTNHGSLFRPRFGPCSEIVTRSRFSPRIFAHIVKGLRATGACRSVHLFLFNALRQASVLMIRTGPLRCVPSLFPISAAHIPEWSVF